MTVDVSVVVACYNAADTIAAALRSATAQTLRSIEVIVADDASTDASTAVVQALAAADPRIRLLTAAVNGGPATARNAAIAQARGRWVAVLDADDAMHPRRLERLMAAAQADAADIAADNMLVTYPDGRRPPHAFLRPGPPRTISLPCFIRGNPMRPTALGYLKPLIRRELLLAAGYAPALRIGEDYDLLCRLLGAGAVFRLYPELGYFYRRHSRSTSHRLTIADTRTMLDANAALASSLPSNPTVRAALAVRDRDLRREAGSLELVAAIKARHWPAALRMAARHPRAALLLYRPLRKRLPLRSSARLMPGRLPAERRTVYVLSRQRLVGAVDGSSAYLLGLCGAMRDAGMDVHLVCPSPAGFGSRPLLRLQPAMDVFASVAVRRGMRVGGFIVALDPSVLLRAARAALGRLGVVRAAKAPYAVALPWRAADQVFIARHAARADAVVADYAFLTDAIPFAQRPSAPSLVVMHDLVSSRAAQFARLGGADTVAAVGAVAEMAMLDAADAVLAIQPTEAAAVRAALPGKRVLLAPMAVRPVAAPAPGSGASLLFVGSNTAPNVDGLRWLFQAVWPGLSGVTLVVAGAVRDAFPAAPPGVRFTGPVRDLAALYAEAALVLVPLRAGSGLKIKLIEALGHGKAVVATSVALQGIPELAVAVAVADTADGFAGAITRLLSDPGARLAMGTRALQAAGAFSHQACYAEAAAFLAPTR